MGCDLPTIKYAVFLFSSISAILGIGNILVNCLALQNYNDIGRIICISMIVLGAIVFLITFVGFYGATRENICLTWTYVICMLALIIGNSVIIFGYISHIDGETNAHKDIHTAWAFQLKGTDAMAPIQTTLSCCGINTSTDYINDNLTIPNSCFVSGDFNKSPILFSNGCLVKLIAIYESGEHWVTIFAWSSLGVEIIAFISACILAITFTNEKRRTRY